MNKSAPITQTNATRYLKAAKAAGFRQVRLTTYPDGRVELFGDIDALPLQVDGEPSPFNAWKTKHEG